MNSLQVLIYEDQPEVATGWASKIEGACSNAVVKTADREDFQQLLELLNRRRRTWRDPGSDAGTLELHPADSTDVVVLDYDLLQYSDSGDTTGSRLAYLLRCFSKCGFIVILNEFGTNAFDLSLASPPEDFADLHIGGVQLGNPGLWQTPFDGYRPWYWPVIPNAKENFERCVADVLENLEAPIFEFLGLDRVIDWIPRRARDFLSGRHKIKMEEVTFKGFVTSAWGGISIKDKVPTEQMARVAAARIATLLNSIILAEQSVLVDAPHLISRFSEPYIAAKR